MFMVKRLQAMHYVYQVIKKLQLWKYVINEGYMNYAKYVKAFRRINLVALLNQVVY
jgi:hypothetical protein